MSAEIFELELRPIDVVRFRTPKPFRIGGYAESELLPPPGTVALAFVAQLYFTKPDLFNRRSFDDLLKVLSERLVFHGPLVVRKGELYLPAPLDLAECPHCKNKNKIFPSRWARAPNDWRESPWPVHDCGYTGKVLRNRLIRATKLTYRRKADVSDDVIRLENICKRESRPGIYLDEATKTVRPGFFYQAEWLSLKSDIGFREFVTVKDPTLANYLKEMRMLRLGGKGRPVKLELIGKLEFDDYYRSIAGSDVDEIAQAIAEEGLFELVLLTPAILLDEASECVSEPSGFLMRFLQDIKLVGMTSHRSQLVSGWNVISGMPRAMYAAVPAGAVYRYKLTRSSAPDEIRQKLIEPIAYDNIGHWSAIGYGTAVVIPTGEALKTSRSNSPS